jgi:hypothetical protein
MKGDQAFSAILATRYSVTVTIGYIMGIATRALLNPDILLQLQVSHGRLTSSPTRSASRPGGSAEVIKVLLAVTSTRFIYQNVFRSPMAPHPKVELFPTQGR